MKKLFTLIALCLFTVISAMADNWSIDFKAIYSASIKADKTAVTLTDDGTISGYSAPSANAVDLSDDKFYIANGKSWLMRPGGLYSFNGGGSNVALKGCSKDQTITLVYTGAAINSVSNTTTVSAGVYKVSADGDVIINVARYGYFEKITIEDPTSDDFDYVVKNNFGDIIANGTSNPTKDPVAVKWSKYIQKDGKWYVTEAPYGISITEATNKTVTYTEANIDYFVECENMSKSRSVAATLNGTGYSNDAAPRHYSNSYWWTAAFPEGGVFTLYIPYRNNNSSGTRISIYTRDSSGNVKDTGLYMDGLTGTRSFTVENINIEPGSSLVLYNTNAYNSNLYMDYLTMTKTGDYTINTTLNGSGLATFSAAFPMQITGAKAYKAVLDGTTLKCTEIEDGLVPAGEGVILEGVGATATATYVASAPAVEDNDLKATTKADGTLATFESCLVLSGNTFMSYEGDAFAANKAYLPYVGTPAPMRIVFEKGEATAIKTVNTTANRSMMFNLAGQRVNNNAKGIVVVNGKKMLNK